MSKDKEKKPQWIRVTKHNGEVHVNPNTVHKKKFLEKQNDLLPEGKKMKIEEVDMTEEELRKLAPFDKDHVPPTQDEVKAFVAEIDAKDQLLSEKDAEIEKLRAQLADKKNAGGSKKNATV